MSDERAVLAAFKAIVDLPPHERKVALQALAPEVRARVVALLAADAHASDLDSSALGHVARRMGEEVVGESLEDWSPPEQVDEFRILEPIGAGGMGIVYRAEQVRPPRQVAIKTLHRWMRSSRDLERFRREVDLLGGLLHPAIPQVYALVDHEGAPYLVMELVDGLPADQATAGWPLRRVVSLLAELADAVQHASQHGVVHGDIKPSNVLVTLDGRPKLLDFGLARSVDGACSQGGTQGYASPGQRADPDQPSDTRTDVYALGRLGQDLCGQTHRDVAAILAKATEPERDDRYPTAAAMRADLQRFLAHQPVVARPATLPYRVERFARRRRGVLTAIAIAATAATAFWGSTAWYQRQARLELLRQDEGRARTALQVARSAEDRASWLTAIARAFTLAPGPKLQQEVIADLAEGLAEGLDLGLVPAVAALEHPSAELSERAALLRRDLTGTRLDVFARGTRIADTFVGSAALFRTGEPAMAVRAGEGVVAFGSDHRPGPAVPWAESSRRTRSWLVDADPLTLVTTDRESTSIWRVEAGELVRVAERELPRPTSALAIPGGILIGSGPPERGLLLWDGEVWSRPDPATDAANSDIMDLHRVDLDADGVDELVGAVGAWRAFGIRTWNADLEVRDHLQIGHIEEITPFSCGPDTCLLARASHRYGSAEVFGTEEPHGEPAGLYVLRWRGGWEVVSRTEPPTGARLHVGRLTMAGDVDGDGDEDLIIRGATTLGEAAMWVWLQEADGGFTRRWVAGVTPVGLQDRDDDPAMEMLAVVSGKGQWWLGLGDTAVPPLSGPPPLEPSGGGARRAAELARLGLTRQAADALADVAGRTRDPDERRRLWAQVAVLHESSPPLFVASLDAVNAAEASWKAALGAVPGDPEAQDGLLRAALARRDLTRAGALAQTSDTAYARTQREILAGLESARPIAPGSWTIDAPESVRVHGRTLDLTTWSNQGRILHQAVQVTSGVDVGLRLTADVARVDVGGGLRVRLMPEDGGAAVIELNLNGHGGSTVASLFTSCGATLTRDRVDPWEAPRRMQLTGRRFGEEQACDGVDSGGERYVYVAGAPFVAPGRYTLRVDAWQPGWSAVQVAELRDVRLESWGLAPQGEVEPAPASSAVDAALVQAVQDGDVDRLRAALAQRDWGDEDPLVDRFLRTEARRLVPLLARERPAWLAKSLGRVWASSARRTDDPAARALLDSPELDALPLEDPGFARLLLLRAEHLARQRRGRQAEHIWARLADTEHPASGDAILSLAQRRLDLGDEQGARRLLQGRQAGTLTPWLDRIELQRHHPALVRLLE